MDPVGSWTAYAASYNARLANAGSFPNATSSELHHHMGGGVQGGPSATSQLLAAHATSGLANPSASPFNPTGFLSPPPVTYDSVFTPLFHQKAHYGIQTRPIKQVESDPYNQMAPNNFYDQNNGPSISWSQNSPQLPSPFGILPHESVVSSPSGAPPKTYENFNAHFAAAQSLNQLTDYKNSSFIDPKKRSLSPPKSAISSATPFFQQMFTPPSEPNSNFKQNEYLTKHFQNGHIQQACSIPSPPLNSQSKEYRIPQPPRPQFPQQRNEKPRTCAPKLSPQKPKLYEAEKRNDDSQSSPISYAMMDSPRGFQSTKLRSQQFQQISNQQSYRFPMTPESDYQRSKSTESFGSTSSNPDCSIGGLPRRPSPLQPQPSPSIPVQSPVYPMYNSPLTTISSPSPGQHDSCFNKQQPEITPPLDVTMSRNSIPNSVITRIDSRYDRQEYNRQQWDERQRRYMGYDVQNTQSRQQYYDLSSQVTLQDLSSCRGDPMSLVKNLQQQQPEKPIEDPSKKRKRSVDKPVESDYLPRVPPPAHHNTNQNGYLDVDRWTLASGPSKIFSTSPVAFNSQSPPSGGHVPSEPSSQVTTQAGGPISYYPSFQPTQSQSSATPETPEIEEEQPDVIVPDIAEELHCLLDDNLCEASQRKRPLCPNPNLGFMSSFTKFLKGDKEPSPPRNTKSPCPKIYRTNPNNETLSISEFPSDPQDDPRYFPLPKSSDKRHFNTSDSDLSESELPLSQAVELKEPIPPLAPAENYEVSPSHERKREKKKKRKKDKKHKKKKKKSKRRDSPEEATPRRDRSRRKAAETTYQVVEDSDAQQSIPELRGSDSDPSWNPKEDDSRAKSSRRVSTRKKSKTSFKESSEDESDFDQPKRDTRQVKRRISISASKKPSEKSQKKLPSLIIYPSKPSGTKSSSFLNIGEFVVLKSDTHLWNPPIWKVTEKTMLQKFLHFVEKGKSLYQNLRFFTGWSPESKKTYDGVTVRVISSSKHDMVVELLSNNIHVLDDSERSIVERVAADLISYRENFEIYIQALFSQALDSNFFNEIIQEHDEYFLVNMNAIDSLVTSIKDRLVEVLTWSEELLSAVDTMSGYKGKPRAGKICACCGGEGTQHLALSGAPYCKDTLSTDFLSNPASHEVILCRSCLTILEVLHNLSHTKYSLYTLCEAKVNERKEEDLEADNTVILNDMLADEAWFTQVFDKVRREWGYAEVLIEKLKTSSEVT